MVNTIKFSQFSNATLSNTTNMMVGVSAESGGINIQTPFPVIWTTATRPSPPFDGLFGYNSTTNQMEFWDGTIWVQLSLGTGTVNTGTANDLAYYQTSTNAVSPLASANGGVLITNNLGVPSFLANPSRTGSILLSGNAASSTWSTSTYPSTNAINTILYASSANVISSLSTSNSSILITNSGGTPSWSTTLPNFTTGSITFSPTTEGIVGTTTNNNASTGFVGEFLSSVISSGSAISVSNNTATDITSLNLGAGDWEVFGNVGMVNGATGTQLVSGWSSSTSATLPDLSLYSKISDGGSGVTLTSSSIAIPTLRYSLSIPTTIYLTCLHGSISGTATFCGAIYARRIR